jgi:hypothetical protein
MALNIAFAQVRTGANAQESESVVAFRLLIFIQSGLLGAEVCRSRYFFAD